MTDLQSELIGIIGYTLDSERAQQCLNRITEKPDVYDLNGDQILAYRSTGVKLNVHHPYFYGNEERIEYVLFFCCVPKGGWEEVHGVFKPFEGDLPFGIQRTGRRKLVRQILNSNYSDTTEEQEPRMPPKLSASQEEQVCKDLVIWRTTGKMSEWLARYFEELDTAPYTYVIDTYSTDDCDFDFMFDLADESLIGIRVTSR